MTDLQIEIHETLSKIVQLDKVQSRLETTRKELKATELEIDLLEKRVNKGLKGIEELDGLSTRAVFYKILGSKESQLEKERQDFLDLNLRYEDALNRQKILEYEINLLSAKLGHETLLKNRLRDLKSQREQEILKSDPKLRDQLVSISESLESEYRLRTELEEAYEKGQLCHHLSSQVIAQLQKVNNWGNWGHKKSRRHRFRMKQEAIDRARNLALQVKHHMHVLDGELRDVGQRLSFDLDFDVLDNFTNFFFDNLITDWIFQQKLTRALTSVGETRSRLKMVLDRLQKAIDHNDAAIEKLKDRKNEIVVS